MVDCVRCGEGFQIRVHQDGFMKPPMSKCTLFAVRGFKHFTNVSFKMLCELLLLAVKPLVAMVLNNTSMLFMVGHLTSSHTLIIIATATRGWHLMRNLIAGHNGM